MRGLWVVAIAGANLVAQTDTDFSGRWVLVEAPQRSVAVPRTLIVQQSATGLGGHLPPTPLSITVERHFADRVERDTYQIGMSEGVVGAPASRPCRSSVRWHENALSIESKCFTASGAVIRGAAERWSLDNRGRLLIKIDTQVGERVSTQTLEFRREGK
jgi:hypothetical protein